MTSGVWTVRSRAAFRLAPTILAALMLAAWSGPSSAAACFRYGEIVTLTGHYAVQVQPPKDGIVRDVRNDAGRRADLLVLDTPLCVDSDALSNAVSAATTIQLHCPAIVASDGSALSATGRLLGAFTGNGHTPVLLVCQG